MTNKDLFTKSLNLAGAPKSIGIKKNDVIIVSSENTWKYIVTLLAGFYIGARITVLNIAYNSGKVL